MNAAPPTRSFGLNSSKVYIGTGYLVNETHPKILPISLCSSEDVHVIWKVHGLSIIMGNNI